jgi:UDP-glucuronate 4-epimerase
MKILVTGSSGFIGSAVSLALLNSGHEVIGIDNHNNYYDPSIKEARLDRCRSHTSFHHYQEDISDAAAIDSIFNIHKPNKVINLAAQAGVRYSIENPGAYIKSNISGFFNVLEACRKFPTSHLVYASSSSVYGSNSRLPFSTHHPADHPLNLYAATKKSNELIAHSYSHLFGLPTTGLRFFTVYGPWGRPDMALYKFTKAIYSGEPIEIFNSGNHRRDFTYIDDVVEGILRVLDQPPVQNLNWNSEVPDHATSSAPWRVYNIGNSDSINLMDYISILEKEIGKTAIKSYQSLQNGDIPDTLSDINDLKIEFGFQPKTKVEVGIRNFVNWYKQYHQVS